MINGVTDDFILSVDFAFVAFVVFVVFVRAGVVRFADALVVAFFAAGLTAAVFLANGLFAGAVDFFATTVFFAVVVVFFTLLTAVDFLAAGWRLEGAGFFVATDFFAPKDFVGLVTFAVEGFLTDGFFVGFFIIIVMLLVIPQVCIYRTRVWGHPNTIIVWIFRIFYM